MADKLLIGISAPVVTAAHWRGGKIAECRTFANDEGGQADFKEYLARLPDMPAQIVVDAVEEDYRFETLPHAFGSDRADMVGRKLKQHYRNSPYMAATLLGRDTGKRRDDRYLFSALTNADLIADWVQAVAARGMPLAGIYLLPMVSGELIGRLDVKATNLLLVAQHATGLRLTFFRDRQFRLSRLTRGDSGRPENRARYFSEEISNTRLYLHALRTMTLDEHLTVLLIDRGDELQDEAAGVARDNPSLECMRVGRGELANRLGIDPALLDASPYSISLHLLGLKTPESNLAPPSAMVSYKRFQARRAIYAGCGALIVAAAVWTGTNLYHTVMLRGETEDAARQTGFRSAQYLEITRQFPQAPTSAENLKKTVEIAQRLRTTAHSPQKVMALLGRVLETSPTIVIREFGWKYGVTEIDIEGAREAAQPARASAGPAGQRKESALVDGEVRPFRGDYRSAIVTINSFAGRLADEPEVSEVRVVKLPLNVNPALSLSGNTLENPEQGGTADFKLLLVLKPAQ
ncbi:MAG: hypothetical protein ACREUB_12415 [Burkholderiales bacterium]